MKIRIIIMLLPLFYSNLLGNDFDEVRDGLETITTMLSVKSSETIVKSEFSTKVHRFNSREYVYNIPQHEKPIFYSININIFGVPLMIFYP